VIEPIDPLERGEFHRLQTPPHSASSNHLRLEKPNHGLGKGVVERIASAADGQLDTGVREALGVADRQVELWLKLTGWFATFAKGWWAL
jgi:hypothetical protein